MPDGVRDRDPALLDAVLHPVAWRRFTAHLLDWTDEPIVAAWTLWWINPRSSPLRAAIAIGWAAWIIWQLRAQAVTGQTTGKRLLRICVVDLRTAAPLGMRRTAARWLLHSIDTISMAGWMAAAVTGRSFADRLTNSSVVRALP